MLWVPPYRYITCISAISVIVIVQCRRYLNCIAIVPMLPLRRLFEPLLHNTTIIWPTLPLYGCISRACSWSRWTTNRCQHKQPIYSLAMMISRCCDLFLLFSWYRASGTLTKETFLLSFAEYSRAKPAPRCATLSQERAMSDNSHSTGSSGSSTNSWTLLSPEVKTHNQISKLCFLLLYPGLTL